ncbi:MAG: extracellular solute-binding protein [Bacillota bacterium]
MKRVLSVVMLLALVISLVGCGGSPAQSGTQPGASEPQPVALKMLVMKQAAYSDASIQEMVKKFQDKNPGITVDVTFVAYESLHDKIVTDQGSGSGEYDVVEVDEIWPAEFAAAGFIRDLTPMYTPEMNSGIIPAVAQILAVNGKQYGVPWILDTKFLFYNKKMLADAGITAPPKTLDELVADAKLLKQKNIVKYPIVWSWAQAEAAVCDYTQLVGAYGGDILTADGKPAFTSGGAMDALKFMKQTLDEGLSNPNSTSALEEDVRQVFSQGEAAFALNWTYMYALANKPEESKVAGQVGIAPAPGKVKEAGVSGSMGLSITKSTKHPEEAWKLITFLTSAENQNQYASESLPIWQASFDNPDQMKAPKELVEVAKVQFANLKGRPEWVPWYNQFSTKLQVSIQDVLLNKATPEKAMQDLAKQVESIEK